MIMHYKHLKITIAKFYIMNNEIHKYIINNKVLNSHFFVLAKNHGDDGECTVFYLFRPPQHVVTGYLFYRLDLTLKRENFYTNWSIRIFSFFKLQRLMLEVDASTFARCLLS